MRLSPDSNGLRHGSGPLKTYRAVAIRIVTSRLVTGMFGGSAGYARGFLPLFVLLVVALPVVGVLNQLGTRHGLGLA
jgi:hypothetical protein